MAIICNEQKFYTFDPSVHAVQSASHGGKGAGLLQMESFGLAVPEFMVVTTGVFKHWKDHGELPDHVMGAISTMHKLFPESMFSVRSGAPVSMPGMMDTLLNVGVTGQLDAKYPGSYRRFVTGWLETVKGVHPERTKELFGMVDERAQDDPGRWFTLASGVINRSENIKVPQDRRNQILRSIIAVFQSWDTPRAKAYREMHGISEDMGTACVVQRMVMGNAHGFSGSGVMFTRDPATGEPVLRGEIAMHAQGEDVVSGAVTPQNINTLNPVHYSRLEALANQLESFFEEVQDIEFTFENEKLYVLQTRTAKMSARARIETACALATHMVPEVRLSYIQARVNRSMVEATRVPQVIASTPIVTQGLAAAPGAISGKIITRKHPLHKVNKGHILVAEETMPEDFPIMAKCGGILTKTGGFTCHSAVVARGIGVPAVVGVGEALAFTMKGITLAGKFVSYGDEVTIDGTSGAIYIGACEVKKAQPPRVLYTTLHDIAASDGFEAPEGVFYYDCGLGERVCLPLKPSDMEQVDIQIYRADRMRQKGKDVAFCFEFQGVGEDLLDNGVQPLVADMLESYGPDLAGSHVLYGAVAGCKEMLMEAGVTIHTGKVQVLDLLDLLEV